MPSHAERLPKAIIVPFDTAGRRLRFNLLHIPSIRSALEYTNTKMAASDIQAKKSRKRSDYGYHQVHQTRW